MSQLPPRRSGAGSRTGKKNSKKRRAKQGLPPAVLPLAIILGAALLIGGIGYGIYSAGLFSRLSQQLSGVSPSASAQWPPPAGTTRENAVGQPRGETIASPDSSNALAPLQRRSADPWFEITNPRWAAEGQGPHRLEFDIRIIERTNLDQHYSLVVFDPDNPRRMLVADRQPLNEFIQSGRAKATLTCRVGGTPPGTPAPSNLEIYLTSYCNGYRRKLNYRQPDGLGVLLESDPEFKVSNTATIGTVPQPTHARAWTESEFAHLTGPADHTSANPEMIDYEAETSSRIAAVPPAAEPTEIPAPPASIADSWPFLESKIDRLRVLVPTGTKAVPLKTELFQGRRIENRRFVGIVDYFAMIVEWMEFPQGQPDDFEAYLLKTEFAQVLQQLFNTKYDNLVIERDEIETIAGYPARRTRFKTGSGAKVKPSEVTCIVGPDFVLTIRTIFPAYPDELLGRIYDSVVIQPGN